MTEQEFRIKILNKLIEKLENEKIVGIAFHPIEEIECVDFENEDGKPFSCDEIVIVHTGKPIYNKNFRRTIRYYAKKIKGE